MQREPVVNLTFVAEHNSDGISEQEEKALTSGLLQRRADPREEDYVYQREFKPFISSIVGPQRS